LIANIWPLSEKVESETEIPGCRPARGPSVATPERVPALQAVDYFLWALQRHDERGESRFLELVWPKVSLVHAVDETDSAPYGAYYTKKRPLV